jgi:hypothetical protein
MSRPHLKHHSGRKQSPWQGLMMAGLFALVSAMLTLAFAFHVADVINAYGSKSWPEASGVILSSKTVEGCERGGGGYVAAIRYQYAVDGVTHLGHRVAVDGPVCGDQKDAAALIERFPAGRRVQVWINRADPMDAVLIAGTVAMQTWFGMFLMLGLAIACGFIAWTYCRGDGRSH